MKFYIDKEYKCHKNDVGNCREFDTPYFDGKSDAVIEGYMFVPGGEVAILNGETVKGKQYTPWKPSTELDKAQREYERQRVSELEAENETLIADMAQLVEEVYQSDVEMMGI